MTPMMEPPLARLAMMAMLLTAVPMRRPATQYSSRDASTFLEAKTPMPMQAARYRSTRARSATTAVL
jgi:hypothetical protein